MKRQRLLRVTETSELLGVHPNTLRKWDNKGILKSIRFGDRKDRRYSIEQIDKLLSKRK